MSGNPGTSGPTPHLIPSHVADVHSKTLRKHIDRKRRYQKPRVVFSCTFCRTRKLKCNRQYPCDNCIKRNQGPVCHYDTERANLFNSTNDLHDRLRFLEEKVQRLERQSTPDANSGGRSSVGDVRERSSHVPGVIFSGHGGTQYVNSGHWRAILSEIEGIGKNGGHAAVADPIDDVERRNRGPELLLGMSASTDIRVLLNAMPSRNIADALVAQYFKSGEISLIFIHTPTFYKEYEQFWADPLQVSIPWLAILYGVLACGLWMQCQTNPRSSSFQDTGSCALYHTHCAICLTSCNYSIPGRYKPEAFVMYLGNEYLQNPTAKSGISILVGCAVRLAVLMGYHRDSRHYPHISVFEGEMRRRLWLFLRVTDSVLSRQYGLPTVIQKGHGDTALPINLLDQDFGPDARALPPAGPETESTPIAKTLSVERVLTVASEILQATSSMEPLSYDKTIELNAKIDEVRSRLSPAFQMQPPSLSTSGINTEGVREVDIALQRCGTEMAIQVARCILHRQYLLRARSETRNDQFQWACLDAARQILHYQQELFQHVLVRAKQHYRVWFPLSHIISDCLTAAMVVSLYILSRLKAQQPVDRGLVELLQGSHQACKSSQSTFVQASRAEGILAAMLELIGSKWPQECRIVFGSPDGAFPYEPVTRAETEEFPMGLVYDVLGGSEFDWVLWDFEMQQLNNSTMSGFCVT